MKLSPANAVRMIVSRVSTVCHFSGVRLGWTIRMFDLDQTQALAETGTGTRCLSPPFISNLTNQSQSTSAHDRWVFRVPAQHDRSPPPSTAAPAQDSTANDRSAAPHSSHTHS